MSWKISEHWCSDLSYTVWCSILSICSGLSAVRKKKTLAWGCNACLDPVSMWFHVYILGDRYVSFKSQCQSALPCHDRFMATRWSYDDCPYSQSNSFSFVSSSPSLFLRPTLPFLFRASHFPRAHAPTESEICWLNPKLGQTQGAQILPFWRSEISNAHNLTSSTWQDRDELDFHLKHEQIFIRLFIYLYDKWIACDGIYWYYTLLVKLFTFKWLGFFFFHAGNTRRRMNNESLKRKQLSQRWRA